MWRQSIKTLSLQATIWQFVATDCYFYSENYIFYREENGRLLRSLAPQTEASLWSWAHVFNDALPLLSPFLPRIRTPQRWFWSQRLRRQMQLSLSLNVVCLDSFGHKLEPLWVISLLFTELHTAAFPKLLLVNCFS